MLINSVTAVYFSPTGTSKKIMNAIINGIGAEDNEIIDITLPQTRKKDISLIKGDIVLIGVPVYEESIPKILNQFLTNLKGEDKPVVVVGVYGNISEGIVLNELYSIASESGFKVVAAATFIGEHSFSSKELPVAENRPDKNDLNKAVEFGQNIMKKMQKITNLNDASIMIPQGKLPLIAKVLPVDSARLFTKKPDVDKSVCNHCNVCVRSCPVGAINKETLEINEELCLRCFSCVKRCKKKARKIIYRPKFVVANVLKIKSRADKEPKIFL